jgi:hypothetical protein
MSLAIKWGDEAPESAGFIYFDATTVYTQNYSGKVTSHPVDGGGNISDHFVRNNPIITISAVITGVDISTGTFLISDPEDTSTPYNAQVAPAATSVTSTDNSLLSRFLPSSVTQFLPDSIPEVVMQDSRDNFLEDVRDMLIRLVYSGKKYNEITQQFDSVIQTIKIYEYQGNLIVRQLPLNPTEYLVITDVTFREDANTGFALYCDIKFEQVEFVSLEKATIPKDVAESITKKATKTRDKGRVDSTPSEDEEDGPAQTDRDGLRTPYGEAVEDKQFQLGGILR